MLLLDLLLGHHRLILVLLHGLLLCLGLLLLNSLLLLSLDLLLLCEELLLLNHLLLLRFLLLDLRLVLHLHGLLDHLYRLLLNLLLSNGLVRSVILLGSHLLLNHLLGLLLLDESLLGVRFGLSLRKGSNNGLLGLDKNLLVGVLLGLRYRDSFGLRNLFLSDHDGCRLLHRGRYRLTSLLDFNSERPGVLLGGADLDLFGT